MEFVIILFLLASSSVSSHPNSICDDYKNKFSDHVGAVMECFSYSLSPVSLCGTCQAALMKLNLLIENRSVITPSGVPCVDLLLFSDRHVIDLVSFVSDVWNQSFCSECLTQPVTLTLKLHTPLRSDSVPWPDWNAAPLIPTTKLGESVHESYNIPVYNNVTVEFFTRLNRTLDCFASFIRNSTASVLDILSFPAKDDLSLDRSACTNCSQSYFELLQFYEQNLLRLNIEPGGAVHESKSTAFRKNRFAVCADVLNAINRTQWAWAKLFDCRPVEKNLLATFVPFIICIAALILFHALSYSACQHPHQMLIYHPKRVEPRLRSIPSASHMSASTAIRDQLSLVPSYGSMGSSSLQYAATVHHRSSEGHDECERTQLLNHDEC